MYRNRVGDLHRNSNTIYECMYILWFTTHARTRRALRGHLPFAETGQARRTPNFLAKKITPMRCLKYSHGVCSAACSRHCRRLRPNSCVPFFKTRSLKYNKASSCALRAVLPYPCIGAPGKKRDRAPFAPFPATACRSGSYKKMSACPWTPANDTIAWYAVNQARPYSALAPTMALRVSSLMRVRISVLRPLLARAPAFSTSPSYTARPFRASSTIRFANCLVFFSGPDANVM